MQHQCFCAKTENVSVKVYLNVCIIIYTFMILVEYNLAI